LRDRSNELWVDYLKESVKAWYGIRTTLKAGPYTVEDTYKAGR
jgi:hypothetical protein